MVGSLVSRKALFLLTSPGVIAHELAHRLTCSVLGVHVEEVKYLQLSGRQAGYVIHEVPKEYWKRISIAFSPFGFNIFVAGALVWIGLRQFPDTYLRYGLYWLSVASVTHSLPSNEDASSLWPHSKLGYLHPLFLITLPMMAGVYLVNLLSTFLMQFGFGVVVTVVLVRALTDGPVGLSML
jgi:hypothetical protein